MAHTLLVLGGVVALHRQMLVGVGVLHRPKLGVEVVPHRLKLGVEAAQHRLKLGVEGAQHRLREVVEVLLQTLVVVGEAVRGDPRPAPRRRMSFSLLLHISKGHKILAANHTFFIILADLDALIDVLLLKCAGNDDEIVLSLSVKVKYLVQGVPTSSSKG